MKNPAPASIRVSIYFGFEFAVFTFSISYLLAPAKVPSRRKRHARTKTGTRASEGPVCKSKRRTQDENRRLGVRYTPFSEGTPFRK
jgi:hypothetical protein